jgi:hypothetical protein
MSGRRFDRRRERQEQKQQSKNPHHTLPIYGRPSGSIVQPAALAEAATNPPDGSETAKINKTIAKLRSRVMVHRSDPWSSPRPAPMSR